MRCTWSSSLSPGRAEAEAQQRGQVLKYKKLIIQDLTLSASVDSRSVVDFQRAHRQWVEEALLHDAGKRDARWSEALAVGSQAFVEKVKRELAMKAQYRDVDEADGSYALCEPAIAYTGGFGAKNSVLRAENAIFWA